MGRWATFAVMTSAAAAMWLSSACAASGGPTAGATIAPGEKISVVAVENFWGSIAAQVGGDHVSVTSLITNANADPHDYEATPSDAIAIARARYVVLNGVGYDPWMDRLLAANPTKGRIVLKVQDLLGLKADDNPHRWYSPDDVMKVIDRMNSDFKTIDPTDAGAFDQQKAAFVTTGLARYTTLVQQIRQKYAGTPVGATESIVVPLADSLGLNLVSPAGFMQATSEGSDPTVHDKQTFDTQIREKQIAVLIFNRQNATPDVQRLVDAAKARGIQVVEITETLVPDNATFQDWQSTELQSLADALARATGK
jgi:zinc/manganese transport system substrate-binding protein